jgi:hypothetical protein
MLVYITIGNSDNKLTQEEWASFADDLRTAVMLVAMTVHGIWYSPSDSRYQNMCVCAYVGLTYMAPLKESLRKMKVKYRQDSIAFATVRDDGMEML